MFHPTSLPDGRLGDDAYRFVDWLEAGGQSWWPMLPLGPTLGKWCAELHRDNGVDLRLGTGVAALLGNGHVEAVELSDGERIAADVVVVGLGAVPNTEWLAGSA